MSTGNGYTILLIIMLFAVTFGGVIYALIASRKRSRKADGGGTSPFILAGGGA